MMQFLLLKIFVKAYSQIKDHERKFKEYVIVSVLLETCNCGWRRKFCNMDIHMYSRKNKAALHYRGFRNSEKKKNFHALVSFLFSRIPFPPFLFVRPIVTSLPFHFSLSLSLEQFKKISFMTWRCSADDMVTIATRSHNDYRSSTVTLVSLPPHKFVSMPCWCYKFYETKYFKFGIVSNGMIFISSFVKIHPIVFDLNHADCSADGLSGRHDHS